MPFVRGSRSPFSLAEHAAAVGAGNLRLVAAGVADEQASHVRPVAIGIGKCVTRLQGPSPCMVLEDYGEFVVLGPGDGRGYAQGAKQARVAKNGIGRVRQD